MRNGDYELVIAPDNYPGKKYRGRYCYEHHLVWWLNTDQVLKPGDVIHHVNGKKRDNRFENLKYETNSSHVTGHNKARGKQWVRLRCPSCGTIFNRVRRQTHLVTGGKATFCSRPCIGKSRSKSYQPFSENVIEVFVLVTK